MEFLEYYRIIRDRIWLVILTAAIAAVIVIVYWIIPPSEYTAEGRLLVHGEASLIMRRTGNEVGVSSSRDFWQTLFQVLRSDYALKMSARDAGITDPRILRRLRPIEGRQESRSSVARVTARAPTEEQAVKLTDSAMAFIRTHWDDFRLDHIKQIETDLRTVIGQTEDDLRPVEMKMAAYQEEKLPGTPSDRLAALEAKVASLEGQIQAAEMELKLAQDRATSLRRMQSSEAAKPLDEQQYGGLLSGELRTLRKELDDKKDLLSEQLEHRTEDHPAVKALKKQIEKLEKDIEELKSGEGGNEAAGSPLQAQILDADLAIEQARHRIEVLTAEANTSRNELPAARARSKEYAKIAEEHTKLINEKNSLLAQIDRLNAERRRLQETDDIEILDAAVAQPTGRTPGKFAFLLFTGIAGGVVIGILVILVLHYVDVTFKNAGEAGRLLDRRILASIPRTDIVMAPAEGDLEAGGETPGGDEEPPTQEDDA